MGHHVRIICPHPYCGKAVTLRKDGTIPKHDYLYTNVGKYGFAEFEPCPNVGKVPENPQEARQ
jgi:hypothetical protein